MPVALSNLYTSISEVMREQKELQRILFYDLDFKQLEKQEMPIAYPAVLFSFEEIIWRKIDDTSDIGTLTVNVKVIFQLKDEIDFFTDNSLGREEIHDCLETLELIHEAISTMTGECFNKLRRFNQYKIENKTEDLLFIYVSQYQTNIKSDATPPDPDLDLDYTDVANNNSFMERKKYNLLNK